MKSTKKPGYKKIAEEIALQIRKGDLAVDDKLPTIQELAKHYLVAPLTIRRAVELLKKNGWVISTPRKSVTVRAKWGSPPARHHIGFAYLEVHSKSQPGLAPMPALTWGLRKGFGSSSIRVSALPFQPDTQLQEFSRGHLDSNIDAIIMLNSFLLKEQTVDFLNSHRIPLALCQPESAKYGITWGLDIDGCLSRTLEKLALCDAEEVALFHFECSEKTESIQQAFHAKGGRMACVVTNTFGSDKITNRYRDVYEFVSTKKPRYALASDEIIAFHVRRAAILHKVDLGVVILDCVWPDSVWPGDHYFDTFEFFEKAGRWLGRSLLDILEHREHSFSGERLQILPSLLTANEP